MKLLPSPLVCRDAVELVSDYLDGTLSRRQRRRLEKHLAQCDACSAYLDQMRATIAASGTVGPEDLPSEVVEGSSTCSVNTEPTSEGPPWLRLTLQSPSTAPVGARTVAAPSSSSRPTAWPMSGSISRSSREDDRGGSAQRRQTDHPDDRLSRRQFPRRTVERRTGRSHRPVARDLGEGVRPRHRRWGSHGTHDGDLRRSRERQGVDRREVSARRPSRRHRAFRQLPGFPMAWAAPNWPSA